MMDYVVIAMQGLTIVMTGSILFRQGEQNQKLKDHERRINFLEKKYDVKGY